MIAHVAHGEHLLMLLLIPATLAYALADRRVRAEPGQPVDVQRRARDARYQSGFGIPAQAHAEAQPRQHRTLNATYVALGMLLLIAGAIHAAATPAHLSQYWLFGAFFVAAAGLQMACGFALLKHSDPLLLRPAALGNAAVVAVWLMSRTVGLPFGPQAWQADPVGVLDSVATASEALFVLVAVFAREGLRPLFMMRETQKGARHERSSSSGRYAQGSIHSYVGR